MTYPPSSYDAENPDFTFGSSSVGVAGTRKKSAMPPPRRKRPEHVPGTSLAVFNPAIDEVMAVETGEHASASAVIGSDYAELMKLRMAVKTALYKGTPMYRCSKCGVPVYLCSSMKANQFFFKHCHEDGNCPAVTRGELSQKELNAIKYNGAKESALHRNMKGWIVECLTADGRFTDIRPESRWVGSWNGQWRQPDVRAIYNGLTIAFEVQLATTYHDIIVERREFYREQGGLLFWIFAVFDSERRRITEDDVFYNNNQNTFIVKESTVVDSLVNKEFMLECVWAQPTKSGGTSAFHRKTVSFHELTLDQASQTGYFFDFEGAKQKLVEDADDVAQCLRDDFEAWCGAGGYYSENRDAEWAEFKRRFHPHGFIFPKYLSGVNFSLFLALYAAKNNKPWGSRRKKLVEVAHRVATAEKPNLTWFMHAVRKYGRLTTMEAEGDPQKWRGKYQDCRKEFTQHREMYQPPVEKLALVEFLFPELCPLPLSESQPQPHVDG